MASFIMSATQSEVPKDFVFPREKLPGLLAGNFKAPIIDLHDKGNLSRKMIKAFQEHGFFQVMNHGVSTALMKDTMELYKELFSLPVDELSNINKKDDINGVCRIYASSANYATEQTHYWRNCLRQCCHPLEKCINYWSTKPDNYREIIRGYVEGLLKLKCKILEHISLGLGLGNAYFSNDLSEDCTLHVNGFPACPDPSSTIGLPKHTDPSLITIVHFGRVPGLRVLRDGQWFGVETPPDAFLVFIGNMLQAVSNGKLRCATHMVTNSHEARISCALFVNPSKDCVIQPAKKVLEIENLRPVYKTFKYKEFLASFSDGKGDKFANTRRAFHDLVVINSQSTIVL